MAQKAKSPQALAVNPNTPSQISPADLAAASSAPTDVPAAPDPSSVTSPTTPGTAANLPPDIIRSLITSPDAPAIPTGTVPTLAPKKPGFLSRLGAGLQKAMPAIEAIGGGLEAAGSPRHEAPNLDRLVNTNMRMNQLGLEKERLQNVEEPMAQAHSKYFQNLGSQYDLTQAGVDANGEPIMVPKKAMGQVAAANINATSRENVENTKASSSELIARLKMGAPMMIDENDAALAGQPQLAGKAINGATLQNYVKVLGSKGYKIQDLGTEGLWVVDRGGNKVKQVSVGSPGLEKASAYASARAAYTPVDVFDENGNLTSISQKQQLEGGVPKAQTVFGEQGPTAASRTMAQSANTVAPHINELQQFIANNPTLVGPYVGRINKFLAGTVGSTGNPQLDEKLGELRGNYQLFKGALARTHFGGKSGVQAAQYFSDLMDAQTSAEGVAGVLESVKPYIQGYSEMQNFTPQKVAAAAPAGGGKKTAAPKTRPPLTSFEQK